MTIKFLGHACFLITSSSGVRIITDPYEPGGFGGQIGYGPITDAADVVLVSHDHADHNYVQGVAGNPTVVEGRQSAAGISFEVTNSFHDDTGGSQRGPNRIFTFEVDGIRLCHLGDLGHTLTKEQVNSIGSVDVLLVPVGGTFTIDAQGADQVIEQLQPSVVIPMHYKTAKVELPIAEVDNFLAGKDNVERPESSSVELSAEDIGLEQRIIVLLPAN